ncbi:MAG: alanine--tRNA ligase [Clostridia bacterium]|nr:alanine--tRNA ligase [Clostridia bacterium]
MKWTGLNEIRESFLSYFESKGHLRLPSYSLIPQNDKSLLLINSGMAPMKKFFTGEVTPPRRRVTTCQKCIRTPDLERVGHTARHGTFFEMLGNFSFGDYFKEEAIPFAWEFLTQVMEIPEDLLWPSIYEKDEEAFTIWHDRIGVPAERIVRLGKEDNFWEHGTGPCGPCSEIYFDRGPKYGCGKPDCRPGCDCDRYMEIWNNVFSQFNNQGDGTYTELSQKNIDTGMGLERLACVMQGVDNMFEVDTIRAIIDTVCEISGRQYGADAENDISIRVITDHVRSSMFMISDGVIPSNEGRGYVLRRIIRRACRHAKLLGISRPFLVELVGIAIGLSSGAYPELKVREEYIKRVLAMEEERFDATIDAGLSRLNDLITGAKDGALSLISGEEVFKLYDTYGFPIDLTKEIAGESGLEIDEEQFQLLMAEQKKRAREARATVSGWSDSSLSLLSGLEKTVFTGYETEESEGKLLAILIGEDSVDSVSEGECILITDKTPFYGEGGGQVGDTGVIFSAQGKAEVRDTKKADGIYLHHCILSEGSLSVGEAVTLSIDSDRRKAIARNHSAAHLLQAALRSVLGTHVEQAGSYVSDTICRFDFTHFAAMTAEELKATEEKVNRWILSALPIVTIETDPETARKEGAMALFGEKYGSVVRMVKMGDCSTELCGGTHCRTTGNLGLFKIVSESSVAAGVRRIEAVTGTGVLQLIEQKDSLISGAAQVLKTPNPKDLIKRAEQLQDELRSAKKEAEALQTKLAASQASDLLEGAVSVSGIRIVRKKIEGVPLESVRAVSDNLRSAHSDIVAVFSIHANDRLNFLVSCGQDAIAKGVNAGNLIREIAKLADGGGGGRPDFATAGAKDATKIDAALEAVVPLVQSMLK